MPALEVVTERLLREEQKLQDREEGDDSRKLLVAKSKKQFTCHYCKKPGYYKKDCRKFAQAQSGEKGGKQRNPSRQPKGGEAMLIGTTLVAKSRSDWIVDSGATSHMCNDRTMFTELRQLGSDDKVMLGDGRTLQAVDVDMVLSDGTRRGCALKKVLGWPTTWSVCPKQLMPGRLSTSITQFVNSGTRAAKSSPSVHEKGVCST